MIGKYSVLLLYPDYLAETFGDTILIHVEAVDPMMAVAKAQEKAMLDIDYENLDPENLRPILVTKGHIENLF